MLVSSFRGGRVWSKPGSSPPNTPQRAYLPPGVRFVEQSDLRCGQQQQHQLPLPVIGLQGPEPGIELLCGKLVPEYFKTLMPHTVWHDSLLPITLKCL